MKRAVTFATLAVTAFAAALFFGVAASGSTVVTTVNGTWTAYPGQGTVYSAAIQQPVNADGSSNWPAKSKGGIPLMFQLSSGTGPFVFQSIWTDNPTNTTNDYSFLSWQSSTPFTFSQLTKLIANYNFTSGDCAGGSLRWTVTLNDGGTERNLDVHYQPGAGGLSTQTCAAGTSGANLIDSTDTIYVTQEFNGTHSFPSAYNNTYADAVSQLGSLPVDGVALIVDSGWGANGNQVVNLSSATVGVGGTSPYTQTFTPAPASTLSPTCNLPAATLKITKTATTATGDVNETTVYPTSDAGNAFRIVDCKYQYVLSIPSLGGAGSYKAEIQIGGTTVGSVNFDLK
jgi:hypothetical protein